MYSVMWSRESIDRRHEFRWKYGAFFNYLDIDLVGSDSGTLQFLVV